MLLYSHIIENIFCILYFHLTYKCFFLYFIFSYDKKVFFAFYISILLISMFYFYFIFSCDKKCIFKTTNKNRINLQD